MDATVDLPTNGNQTAIALLNYSLTTLQYKKTIFDLDISVTLHVMQINNECSSKTIKNKR